MDRFFDKGSVYHKNVLLVLMRSMEKKWEGRGNNITLDIYIFIIIIVVVYIQGQVKIFIYNFLIHMAAGRLQV